MSGPTTSAIDLASRIRGCLLGGAVGDALGDPIEFLHLDRIRQAHGPTGLTDMLRTDGVARITDDTQMSLFTVEALIRADNSAHRDEPHRRETAVRRGYQRWLETQGVTEATGGRHATGWLREQHWLYHRRAPGNACLSGLRHPGDGIEAFDAWGGRGPINPDSKGCGTVMRAAPFAVIPEGPREAFELAARCSLYTHGHPTGYYAAGALAAIVFQLYQQTGIVSAVSWTLDLLREYPGHEETVAALERAVRLAAEGEPTPEKVETLGGGWIAEEALAIAVYSALAWPRQGRYHRPSDLAGALLLSVNHSGDSDSTGAICGNILGAEYGVEMLPGDWLLTLEHRATLLELAEDQVLAALQGRSLARDSQAWLAKYPPD